MLTLWTVPSMFDKHSSAETIRISACSTTPVTRVGFGQQPTSFCSTTATLKGGWILRVKSENRNLALTALHQSSQMHLRLSIWQRSTGEILLWLVEKRAKNQTMMTTLQVWIKHSGLCLSSIPIPPDSPLPYQIYKSRMTRSDLRLWEGTHIEEATYQLCYKYALVLLMSLSGFSPALTCPP